MKYPLLIGALLFSRICLAGFNEGAAAYGKGDYSTALKEWQAVAEQKSTLSGDFEWHSTSSEDRVNAQYGLGLLYWQGKGVDQNYQQAEKWLTLAANTGYSEAQLKLAYLYLTGLHGLADVNNAIKWFDLSAQQGNVDAQYNLGLLYFKGLGVSQNRALAKKWLTAAAKQGEPAAKTLLMELKAPPKAMPRKTIQATPITAPAAEKPSLAEIDKPTEPVVITPKEEPVLIKETQVAPIAVPAAEKPSLAEIEKTTEPVTIKSKEEPVLIKETQVVQTADSAPSNTIASLTGSKWHYVDADWQFDLEFAANGVLHTTHPKDNSKDNDEWEQDDNEVNFYFNNKFSHFEGSLSSENQMSGTASNKKGATWSWKVTRIN